MLVSCRRTSAIDASDRSLPRRLASGMCFCFSIPATFGDSNTTAPWVSAGRGDQVATEALIPGSLPVLVPIVPHWTRNDMDAT